MKKIISLALIGFILSGCSLFRVHKNTIEQGNVITAAEVSQLHRGMSEHQVKEVLGTPLLVNIFSPGRIEYIYTIQEGYGHRQDVKLTCLFSGGRLTDYRKI